ncbi:MAG TPA: FtsQ-type POTRA domain-containing protein [Gemmatimonadaceae bacterium]|nr:FtsQ-type POTRA domain-containing protein [Gemmatimonadaceae bacterium]
MSRLRAVAARLGWRGWSAVIAALALLASPVWAPPLLSHLSYFRVRSVEIVGARFIPQRDVLGRLALDSGASVWDDYAGAEQRIRTHPQVASVHIGRRLPGTLVVRLEEDAPVALVATDSGVVAVDVRGRILPIDLLRVNVDLPVLAAPDTSVLALLDGVRTRLPALFARISDVERAGAGELVLHLNRVTVRARRGVTPRRLGDIIPVERDLERRHASVAELDLRFRDQVIARLQ